MNRMVGGTLGVAVIGAVFAAQAPAGVEDPAAFVHAFSSAMWVATAVTALGAALAIGLLRGRAERAPAPAPEVPATALGEFAAGEITAERGAERVTA